MKSFAAVTLAVVGTVAAGVALFNSQENTAPVNFLQTDYVESLFLNHIAQYQKSYATKEEYNYRLNVFKSNFEMVVAHNSQNEDAGFEMTLNMFADMNNREFAMRLGSRPPTTQSNGTVHDHVGAPESIDWREKKAVNPVKNQGSCGSCWAFSAVAAIEGAYAVQHGDLLSFSEQQLVDCSRDPADPEGNQGCDGGWMTNAFEYAEKTALETEDNYPYTAEDDTCELHSGKGVVKVKSFVEIPPKDGLSLLAAVAQQPVSIAVNAGSLGFQFYSKGILKSLCGTNLDHGITIVGYGTENKVDYWIVRNSWGSGWGESGYVRIKRTDSGAGICGENLKASYPIVQ